MTLTVRSATVTGATTKGSALTHAEMDANWAHVIDSSNQTFVQSGTGATSGTVQIELRHYIRPEQFGAAGDGSTDDAAAITSAATAAGSTGCVILSRGKTYRVASNITYSTSFEVEAGASFEPDSGRTITVSGNLISRYGEYNSGLGTVTVSGSILALKDSGVQIGINAGDDLTSGADNILLGQRAGRLLTTGTRNICIGKDAGRAGTTWFDSICIGNGAGFALQNGDGITTGGFQEVLIGEQAGLNLTTGPNNVMIGSSAGKATTTGGSNTIVGRASFNDNTQGGFNVGIGHAAGFDYTTGSSNTFVGNQAGHATISGNPARTGSFNVAVGELSGATLETADNSVCVGTLAEVEASNQGKFGQGLDATTISGRLYADAVRVIPTDAAGITYTTAQFVNGTFSTIIRSGPAGAFSDTTPSAADIVAAIPGCETGTGYYLTIMNNGGGLLTILAGTNVTLVGTTTVANGSCRLYMVTVTNSGTPAVTVQGVMTGTV